MSKITWDAGTLVYPLPPVMITSGTMDHPNVFTAAWTGIINSEPAMTYVSVRKERYSHDLIEKNSEFVINLTTEKLVKAADFCGVKSGKDVDKFAETKLTPIACTVVKAPQIAESPISVECQVTEVKHLGSHDMFLAKIVAVNVDDSFIENGRLALEKTGLVAYCHGQYYGLGASLGKFGFSVEKKKSRKQRIHEIKHDRAVAKLNKKEIEEQKEMEPVKKGKFDKKDFGKKGDFSKKAKKSKKFDKPVFKAETKKTEKSAFKFDHKKSVHSAPKFESKRSDSKFNGSKTLKKTTKFNHNSGVKKAGKR